MDNFKTTTGRDSFPEQTPGRASTPSMSEFFNPHALPFQPGNFPRQQQFAGAFENQLPQRLPHQTDPSFRGHQRPYPYQGLYEQPMAWHGVPPPPPRNPPPPPMPQQPPHMSPNQHAFHEYAAYQEALKRYQWMVDNGHVHPSCPPPPPPNFHPSAGAYAAQTYGPPYQPQHGYQHHIHQPQQPPMARAHYSTMHSGNDDTKTKRWDNHGQNKQVQWTNKTHCKAMPSMKYANSKYRVPAPQKKKSKSAKPLSDLPFRIDLDAAKKPHTNNVCRVMSKVTHPTPAGENKADEKKPGAKKGRYGDEKIMLPPPELREEYLIQATKEPSASETPGQILVILDLNGTVLFRPNRNSRTMIARPFLQPFLRYLFDNFKVMVWSSAKPENVKSLVSQALDNDLRSKLVDVWGRESFGLSASHYAKNVQVYKNLKLVWCRGQIQSFHPDYETGGRFGQHNTVLIDDSAIKASAQPYNLLEIPEFSATPDQMNGDVLREVAGYLEALRWQTDVSSFIKTEPFKDGGRWTFDWPDSAAGGGEMTSKATATATAPSKKNNKKKLAREAAAAATETKANILVSQTIDSLASVSLAASVQKDW
ncbi:phosphoprotein phosphatase [Pyrenophora tritici-repentis]|nr:phosphoprotein phosphatase [Pyrenophora tritici-repentis]KAG9384782.1 phosphoprotein phosphatase [Pyrenophora tritici-repentis]KAI0577010.1 phosphoprotein phosphatase [Pyrenophora tritici-repentis]KAI0607254.1 phosphoprotein phosphatase [Pyrenophora tritici-repentis]KAI0619420.1 phosphoprotein phosphatase [Pyrenophora tritici-repentis]